ncbi:protein PPP1R35 homolog [Anopheles maculipalpis]|uniref:protein PPP1R35 homolog n=1 Tax=Anopheles maculipalpis TaxID=1496333 RepID=UPI0021594FCF|nr:protein PPP1R35 homolog [Anopheles maculipalpis]
MGKHKHGNRKRYLCNVDVPLSRSTASVLKSSTGDNLLPAAPKSILKPTTSAAARSAQNQPAPSTTAPSSSEATKYKQPELHTTLGLSKRIETVKKLEPQPITSMGQLTPNSKKRVNTQITKQLNHQYDQSVFKKLAPVNVNDTVLLPAPGSRTAAASSKSKYLFKDKKDPEPTLSDYLRPIPRFTIDFVPHISTPQLMRVTAGDSWNNFHNIEYVQRIMEEH